MKTGQNLEERATIILATWFGCGKVPRIPGTVGTLGAVPLLFLFSFFAPLQYMLATLVFTVLAIFVSHLHESFSGKHDSQEIVIDEVAGLLVTMTWVPFTWPYVVAGFLLFRFFDMLKPWPISYLDKRVGGGVGTVADDLLAGILSNIILQVIMQKGWL